MDGQTAHPQRRTVTPTVLGAALFVAACATFAVTFVAGRGGLQMPVAATHAPVAVASEGPAETEPVEPTPPPTLEPPASLPPPSPTVEPTVPPTPIPTVAGPTLDPNDPLARLPQCPGHPGCFEYVVVRGDTLTGIVSRYLLSITTVLALNPELTDPGLIVVGQTLYLGRDPFARLDPCANAEPCSLYVVQAGDRVADIAARYSLTEKKLRDYNPTMSVPIQIGEIIKIPHPT